MPALSGVVIGLGSQGCKHAVAIMNHPGATLAGVTDTNGNAWPRLSAELGAERIPAFDDTRNLVTSVRPDFAIVAVPPRESMLVVRELCSRQVPCLMEKPLAPDLEQARTMVSLPGFSDLVMVATQRRYSSLDRSVVEWLESRQPSFFSYNYALGLGEVRSSWRREDARGCLIDMGYHVADRVCRWFGRPDSIRATLIRTSKGTSEHVAEIRLRYTSGIRGWVSLSPISEEKEERFSIKLNDGGIAGSESQITIRSASASFRLVEQVPDLLAAQLSFFLERVRLGQGFRDLVASHLSVMELMEECYPSPWAESIIKSL
jgi:predicted dehydrogenase